MEIIPNIKVIGVKNPRLSAVLCYIYMYRKFDILQSTPKERRFQSKLAKTLLYIGVPMGLQFSITAIGSIMLQSANNALGTACVAAFTLSLIHIY